MKKIILLVCVILCSCIGSTFATKYVAITTDDPNRQWYVDVDSVHVMITNHPQYVVEANLKKVDIKSGKMSLFETQFTYYLDDHLMAVIFLRASRDGGHRWTPDSWAQNIAIYPNMPIYDMGAFVYKEAFKKSF